MPVLSEPAAVSVEKILMATDFTVSSTRALAYAKALALRFDAELDLVSVFDSTVTTSWEAAELEIPPEERLRMMHERLARLERGLASSGVATRSICRGAHRPALALLEVAREESVDLIVAGTNSKVGLERMILGSTAEQLIRGADCPVLTVGPKARKPEPGPLTFRTVVFANDFSPEATKAAVYALSFAEDAGAKLYSCYAIADRRQYLETREALDRCFKEALEARIPAGAHDWCSPECVVEHVAASQAILDLAERVGADLIVLGARKATFWLNHVERGITPAVLAEASCPVMTIC